MIIRDYFQNKVSFNISSPMSFDWMNIIKEPKDQRTI